MVPYYYGVTILPIKSTLEQSKADKMVKTNGCSALNMLLFFVFEKLMLLAIFQPVEHIQVMIIKMIKIILLLYFNQSFVIQSQDI